MASIGKEANGRRRILFVAPDGKRKTIRLGKIPQRGAEAIKVKVELLVAAVMSGCGWDNETARWVAELPDGLAGKLAAVGLMPPRTPGEPDPRSTLGAFLADYMARRIDVKPATKVVWAQVARNLTRHFGSDRELSAVTEGDAEDFKMFLVGEGLAPTTIHKRLQVARMFFRSACKRKLADSNPFADVSAQAVISDDRKRFVTAEEYQRVMAVCDPTWRTIVALARYGGLRCPSEVLSLRWQDVNWETERVLVQSPKTEHHPGKGNRTIPLFPQLKAVLLEAFELAPDGAEYVVGGGYLKAAQSPTGWRNCNLRTQFERIVKRAGLNPWPRPFHALRASRETELAANHPMHVVTAWLGNTPRIALKHYLQVTDSDFEQATQGGTESGTRAAQNAAHRRHKMRHSTRTRRVAMNRKKRNKPLLSKGLCEMVRKLAKPCQ